MLCRSLTYHVQFRKYRRTKLSPSFWITLYNYNYFSERCSKGLPPHLPPTVDEYHSELRGCTTAGPKEELQPQDFLSGPSTVPFTSLPAICLSFHCSCLRQHWRRDCLQTMEHSGALLCSSSVRGHSLFCIQFPSQRPAQLWDLALHSNFQTGIFLLAR